MKKLKSICVFGGAKDEVNEIYKEHAKLIGKGLAERGIKVVYGGSNTGVMHAAASGAMDAGGYVVGVYPDVLKEIESLDIHVTELVRVKSMYRRKKLMVRQSDAFIILPGGYGTLDELFEILTLNAIGFLDKPLVIYNQDGFWDELKVMIEKIIEREFASHETTAHFEFVSSVDEIFQVINKLDEK